MLNSKIWIHFVKLGKVDGYKQNRASCKYCNYEMNESVGRCEAHLKKCSYVPESVLQSLFGSNYPITSSLSSSSLPPSLSLSSLSSVLSMDMDMDMDSPVRDSPRPPP